MASKSLAGSRSSSCLGPLKMLPITKMLPVGMQVLSRSPLHAYHLTLTVWPAKI